MNSLKKRKLYINLNKNVSKFVAAILDTIHGIKSLRSDFLFLFPVRLYNICFKMVIQVKEVLRQIR